MPDRYPQVLNLNAPEHTATTPTKIYCSDRCRKHAWEQRKHRAPAITAIEDRPPAPQPAATQDCPHCGEPITIVALLTTPEAARPPVPDNDTIIPLQQRTC